MSEGQNSEKIIICNTCIVQTWEKLRDSKSILSNSKNFISLLVNLKSQVILQLIG